MNRLVCLLGSFFVLATAFACSGGDSVSMPGTSAKSSVGFKSSNDANGLKSAVKRAKEALYQGDNKSAYEAFSRTCRESVPYSSLIGGMVTSAAAIKGVYNKSMSDLEVVEVDVRYLETGKGEAQPHVRFKNSSLEIKNSDTFRTWVYEDGGWHEDFCSAMIAVFA